LSLQIVSIPRILTSIYLTNLCIIASLSIFYAKALYENINGTKTKVGVGKSNLSLRDFDGYLQQINMPGDGFSLVVELDGKIIATSAVSPDTQVSSERQSAFNVKYRSIGKLTKQLVHYLGSLNVQKSVTVYTTLERKKVIVSLTPFKYDNIQWTLIVVVIESEIINSIFVTTYITIGVTIAIIVLGMLTSVLSGHIITRPFMKLKKEFQKIARLDFDSVQPLNSVVPELSHIYRVFNYMVVWLKEFRVFVPDAVLEEHASSLADSTYTIRRKTTSFMKSPLKTNQVTDESVQSGEEDYFRSKLDLGLSLRSVTIAYIEVDNNEPDIVKSCRYVVQAISDIAHRYKGKIQLYHPFRMAITWNSVTSCRDHQFKACSAMMEIVKNFEKLESNYTVYIGIATGEAQCGICGTETQRIVTTFGDCEQRASEYKMEAIRRNCRIVADKATVFADKVATEFIYRPISGIIRIKDKIEVQFELISKKLRETMEWMYELEHAKVNDRYLEFNSAVSLIIDVVDKGDKSQASTALQNALILLRTFSASATDESDLDLTHQYIRIAQQLEKNSGASIVSIEPFL
jgi:hypothetical protein